MKVAAVNFDQTSFLATERQGFAALSVSLQCRRRSDQLGRTSFPEPPFPREQESKKIHDRAPIST